MKPLRLIGYIVLAAAIIGLASGRLLRDPLESGEFHLLPAAIGLLTLSASVIYFSWRNGPPPDRLAIYWAFIMVLTAIQISGGLGSLLYPVLLLFLAWVALPGTGGKASDLGLLAGITAAIAMFSASALEGPEPFFSRLVTLLPGMLRAFVIPSLFGFSIEWLAGRCATLHTPGGRRHGSRGRKLSDDQGDPPPAEYREELINMLHTRVESEATCLFLRHDDTRFRLELSAGGDAVMSRYMLPADHRLVRMLGGLMKSVSARVDSPAERKELLSYRRRQPADDSSVWLMLCPLVRSGSLAGFILQDFEGKLPPRGTARELESAARILGAAQPGDGAARRSSGQDTGWIRSMIAACEQGTLDQAMRSIAGIISEAMFGATISIADVESSTGETRVWVSRGPLARWRRDLECSGTGVAGWIVRNGAPCRRCGISRGEKSVSAFTDSDDASIKVGSCMGAPVTSGGTVIGLIMAEHEDDDAFHREHEAMLHTAAGLLSMDMELSDLRNRCGDLTEKDSLTGLPRAPLLFEHLQLMAGRVQAYGGSVSVIIADMDGFSAFNENFGYSAGDEVLREAAHRFRGCFSPEIFIARVGSDSFAACHPSAGRVELEALLPRIIDALSWTFSADKGDSVTNLSVSIGACCTKTNRKVLKLIGEAERALSEASVTGPGASVVRNIGRGRENGRGAEVE